MSIRYAIAAIALSGGACVAHADVLPAAATTQSGYLSGWTTANGTDVVGSGVLASGSTLIGGVARGNDALAQALFDKASANLGAAGAPVTLSYAQGIEGSYLVGMSNAKIAAALGNSVSVVGSGTDILVSTGNAGASTGTGTTGSTGSTGGSGSTGSTGSGGGAATGGTGSTGGTGGSGADTAPAPLATDPAAVPGGAGNAALDVPGAVAPLAEVPEPSTIALMLAGALGAIGLGRRRRS